MPAALWIDVDDLILYGEHTTRPTGIQRVVMELCTALQAELGPLGLVHFVRHNRRDQSFDVVPWSELRGLIDRFSNQVSPPPPPLAEGRSAALTGETVAEQAKRQRRRKMSWIARGTEQCLDFLPPAYHGKLTACLRFQYWALLCVGDLARYAFSDLALQLRRLGRRLTALTSPVRAQTGQPDAPYVPTIDPLFAQVVRPGDVLVVLGAPDSHYDYTSVARRHQADYGMRVAQLFYDLIPILRPEWFKPMVGRAFREWHTNILPELDCIFAISQNTARDIARYAAECGVTLRSDIGVVPMGTGFSTPTVPVAAAAGHLPPAGSYVLFVSTVEIRKNHILLFRVWRQLLANLPHDRVPMLVFAGAVGWLVQDLIEQMENSEYLDGKLLHLTRPTDADLAALYRGALFTLYPSYYEGWGLPVSESFAFGKPCITANTSSLPEAGGALARYFDPENFAEAYRVILDTIEDRPGLAAWEAMVQRDFRLTDWVDAARMIATGLGAMDGAASPIATRLSVGVSQPA